MHHDFIKNHPVQYRKNKLFYKNCTNDEQYMQRRDEKPKREIMVTIISFCSGKIPVPFNIAFWYLFLLNVKEQILYSKKLSLKNHIMKKRSVLLRI